MATANTSRRRLAAAGALALAALGGPALAALAAPSATHSAAPRCLTWYGAREDGICLLYSDGTATYIGTPSAGIWGPEFGPGLGLSTGPLLPGQTINIPIGGQ